MFGSLHLVCSEVVEAAKRLRQAECLGRRFLIRFCHEVVAWREKLPIRFVRSGFRTFCLCAAE